MTSITSAPALAQTGPRQPVVPDDTALARQVAVANPAGGDIVVTARRREESLSKVPVAVVALGSDQLAARTIVNESDLQAAVPGLTIRENGNANSFNYAIRGQTIDTYTNSPPGVLPYINEAQVATRTATAFYDLSGVQVLKGPQGTLFGRNAVGGAVLYQTTPATAKFGGYVTARYGNYDAYQVQGALNLPVSARVFVRVAVSQVGGGAFVRNLARGDRTGNLEQTSVRGTLTIAATDALKNTTVVEYTHDGGTNTPGLAYRSSAYTCGNGRYADGAPCAYGPLNPGFTAYLAAHPTVYPGGVTAYANLQDQLGPWKTYSEVPLKHGGHATFVINTTQYSLNDDVTIKNIFLFNKAIARNTNDYDGTPYPVFTTIGTLDMAGTSQTNQIPFINQVSQTSNELQVQGKAFDRRLSYTVGGFFFRQIETIDSALSAFDFSPIAPPTTFFYRQETNDRSLALFAQTTYAITDRLNLTAGYRHTWEDVKFRQLPGSLWTLFLPANNPFFPQEVKTNKPSWNISLDYLLTPGALVYVTTRGSWRAGGFNYTLLPADRSTREGGNRFNPETTKDVEVGFKYSGRGLGFPATLNVALYNQWTDDVQRSANVVGIAGSATLLTVNVPKAQVAGVETDLSVHAASWLNVGGSLAYTHARFTKNQVTFASVFSSAVFRYGPYADAPRWIGSVFAEATQKLGSDLGFISVRADVFYQSKFYFSNLNVTVTPGTDIDSYSLLNGRIAWNDVMGRKVSLAIFGRNLLNKQYYTGGNATGSSLGVNTATPGRPRFFGGEIRVVF